MQPVAPKDQPKLFALMAAIAVAFICIVGSLLRSGAAPARPAASAGNPSAAQAAVPAQAPREDGAGAWSAPLEAVGAGGAVPSSLPRTTHDPFRPLPELGSSKSSVLIRGVSR